jgi:hypothetical protein
MATTTITKRPHQYGPEGEGANRPGGMNKPGYKNPEERRKFTPEEAAEWQKLYPTQGLTQSQVLEQTLADQAANGSQLAQIVLQQFTNQNIAQSTGVATSQKGINPALAARQAGQNAAYIGQQSVGQSGIIKAQTQAQAQELLASIHMNRENNMARAKAQQEANDASLRNALISGGLTATGAILAGPLGASAGNMAGRIIASRSETGEGTWQQNPSPTQVRSVQGNQYQGYNPQHGQPTPDGRIMFARGGKIPGKPEVQGDSLKNDKVPIMASPGEIIVPRTKAKDPEKAHDFIDHLLRGKKKKENGKSFSDVVLANRRLQERIAHLEGRQRRG